MTTAVIVLAAGKGTRMKSQTPKVLHKVAGREMVLHVLEAASAAEPEKIVTVLGHGSEQVEECVKHHIPESSVVEQTEQKGTGHAVMVCEEALKDFSGNVLILCGDVPMVDAHLVEQLIASHYAQENDVTFVTAFVDDPTGLGRIIRDDHEDVQAIVEHKDATEEQRAVDEINVGIYIAKSEHLFKLLHQIGDDNAQGEYYITDIVSLGLKDGLNVGTYTAENADELMGVNSRLQLSYMEDLYQNKLREHFMAEGVTLIDPQSVFFAWDTKIANDVTIGPFVHFGERVRIESGVEIEGNCRISNSHIGQNSFVKSFCHISGAEVGSSATVGPFARLREGTELAENTKAGSFTEFKKAKVGKNSSVAHLSYMGDVEMGEDVNIGGGTILANYNHATKEKFKTVIENGVATGVNNSIVAPCTLGEKAYIGAGTTIMKDVPARALATNKKEQVNKPDYIKE